MLICNQVFHWVARKMTQQFVEELIYFISKSKLNSKVLYNLYHNSVNTLTISLEQSGLNKLDYAIYHTASLSKSEICRSSLNTSNYTMTISSHKQSQ